MDLRIAVAQPGIHHHLFGVVCPAFDERVCAEMLADIVCRTIGMQELQEVARPYLVNRDCEQIGLTTPEYALYGFALFYALCLVLNWWFYMRPNAYIKNP